MKRKAMLAALIALILITSCRTEERTASAKALSTGGQALEAIDGYLDGRLSYDNTKSKLDDASKDMAYVSDQSQEDEHFIKDFTIQSDLTTLAISLIHDNFANDSDSYDDLLEKRNKLAEDLGEKTR